MHKVANVQLISATPDDRWRIVKFSVLANTIKCFYMYTVTDWSSWGNHRLTTVPNYFHIETVFYSRLVLQSIMCYHSNTEHLAYTCSLTTFCLATVTSPGVKPNSIWWGKAKLPMKPFHYRKTSFSFEYILGCHIIKAWVPEVISMVNTPFDFGLWLELK